MWMEEDERRFVKASGRKEGLGTEEEREGTPIGKTLLR